jgi:hypothetical protein
VNRRGWGTRLKPSWQQSGVLGAFGVVLTIFAWPTLNGRTSSVVPSFQTATYPWAARPRGLAFTWPQSDQAESTFPWAVLARRTWRSGDLPLWDPHSFGGGVPWATDGVAATLYPVRALLDTLFLPWLAHDLFVLVHLALAGAGAYWLARRWGAGHVGGTIAGVGWMTNAYVWVWAPLEMVTPFFAALPLALAATERALRSPSRANVAWGAVALGLGMVAGNIAYSVILAATCGLYLAGVLLARLVRTRRLRDRETGRAAAAGAGVFLVGLGLAAVVLVPTLLNLFSVSRQPFTFEALKTSFMVPWDTYRAILERPASPPTAEQMNLQVHLTPVVVVLAVAGLLLARGFGAWSARTMVLLTVLIASSVPGAWVAYHVFPGFDAVKPYGRLLPIALLAACVLAGLGAERLWQFMTSRLRRPPATWVAVAVSALLLAGVFVPSFDVVRSQVPPALSVKDYPLYPRTPLIREIKDEQSTTGWPLRVLPAVASYATDPPSFGSLVLVGGSALAPGIDTWGGYASAVPEATSDLVRLVGGEPEAAVLGEAPAPELMHPVYIAAGVDWALACRLGTDLVALSPGPPDGVEIAWGSLDTRGVDEVYSGADGQVHRLPDTCSSAPRLAPRAVVAESDEDALRLLRSQGAKALASPGRTDGAPVVLSDAAGSLPTHEATGEIRSATRDGGSAVVEVSTDGEMWLSIPVAFDEGWTVSVDGEQVAAERVDFNRVGVLLDAGDHEVELSYRPPGWVPGMLGSAAALLALVALVATGRRRREP